MCELFALSASAPVDIKLSLAELARHGGETGIHADGWGAAFLEGRDARVFREPQAAAYSPWVQCLQDHPIRSDTVIAHIRHATRGAVSLANTQPFARELRGHTHVFAHNGHLGDMVLPMRATGRFTPIGETNSKSAFCLFMNELAEVTEPDDDSSADRLTSAFASFTRRMRELGPANIIFAANRRLLVHADRRTQRPGVIEPPGLWMLQRSCLASKSPASIEGGGVCIDGLALSVVLVASVPLTAEPWQPLERGCVLELHKGYVASRHVV